MADYGLSRYDAVQLTNARATADFFEQAVKLHPNPKEVCNWIQNELFRLQTAAGELDGESTGHMTPERLVAIIQMVDQKTISRAAGKHVFESVYREGGEPASLVDQLGLAQVTDDAEVERFVAEVLAANPAAVADYQAGKAGAVNFLAGQVMKVSRGRANPNLARELIERQLSR
jgi:aspartyl-tRNA(Asn)/glutamyl-tRNA(Gln) amidotransferase subunit B